MKSNSTFKLSKQTKRLAALLPFRDQHDRNEFKRGMIDAQLSAAVPQSFKERK
jgi:alkyl sulfatase BDS1-like metallo-beta-lactamase superfamily hydrolase